MDFKNIRASKRVSRSYLCATFEEFLPNLPHVHVSASRHHVGQFIQENVPDPCHPHPTSLLLAAPRLSRKSSSMDCQAALVCDLHSLLSALLFCSPLSALCSHSLFSTLCSLSSTLCPVFSLSALLFSTLCSLLSPRWAVRPPLYPLSFCSLLSAICSICCL